MIKQFLSGFLTPLRESFDTRAKMDDARFGELKDEMRAGSQKIDIAADGVTDSQDSSEFDTLLTEFYAVLDVQTMRTHNKFLAMCKNGNESIDVDQALSIEKFYTCGIEAVQRVMDAAIGQDSYKDHQARYEDMQNRSLDKIWLKIRKIEEKVKTESRQDYKASSMKAFVSKNLNASEEPRAEL